MGGQTVCSLVKANVRYEGGEVREMVGCELHPENLAEGEEYKMVEVEFLPSSVTEKIDSGTTDLVLEDAIIIEETGQLTIAPGASYQVSNMVCYSFVAYDIPKSTY
jgi:hypothetical protein